jgi:molecular chaperone DnaK
VAEIKNVIGIDLGTVNSAVAIVRDGKPIILRDTHSDKDTVPSIFAINSKFEHIVGYQAEAEAEVNRLNTIFAVKRLIGRKYNAPDVQEAIKRLPYKIIPAKNGDAWVEIDGQPMSPEQVSGFILKYMRDIAEARLGEKVQHAVISVPAHFNDAQRQATRDAGRIAGMTVLNIINEPTAAALAYGIDLKDSDKKEKIIAVFDLGGGTFDITILKLHNGLFDVMSTGGDTFLGGEDYDLAMVAWLLEEFKNQAGVDLAKDRMALQRIKTAARNARHELSFKNEVLLNVANLSSTGFGSGTENLTVTLTRKAMEALFGQLTARLDPPCMKAMVDAGIRADDIDDIVLVGGMTKMPTIRRQSRKIFGRQSIDTTVDPDQAVALGAAVQGALMQGILSGVSLADVTPLTLSIETEGGMCTPIIPRNTKVPANITKMFTTSGPNQKEMNIHLLQGESPYVFENKSLGFFKLVDIPPAPRGIPKIAINLSVDVDSIVRLSAEDQDTGDKKNLEIFVNSGLSEEDLNKLVRENRTLEQEQERRNTQGRSNQGAIRLSDEEKKKRRDLDTYLENAESIEFKQAKEELRRLIYSTQFDLDINGKKFKGPVREELDKTLQYGRVVLENAKELEEIQVYIENIKELEKQFRNFLDFG